MLNLDIPNDAWTPSGDYLRGDPSDRLLAQFEVCGQTMHLEAYGINERRYGFDGSVELVDFEADQGLSIFMPDQCPILTEINGRHYVLIATPAAE
jgi:hypothetical protein